jgi:hypothetical protein
MLHRVNSFYCINKKGWNRNTNVEHCSTSLRGVWRSWQRACLACMRSPVRFRQCPLLVQQVVAASHACWTLQAFYCINKEGLPSDHVPHEKDSRPVTYSITASACILLHTKKGLPPDASSVGLDSVSGPCKPLAWATAEAGVHHSMWTSWWTFLWLLCSL